VDIYELEDIEFVVVEEVEVVISVEVEVVEIIVCVEGLATTDTILSEYLFNIPHTHLFVNNNLYVLLS
jgi:hypothetical protein